MKTIFLDFDGVLHSMSDYLTHPFNRLPLLENLIGAASFDIVVSSSWRFHQDIEVIKGHLGKVSSRVIGVTGDAVRGPHARYQEICAYANQCLISDWRALDDAHWEFPPGTPELIACDPRTGLTVREVKALHDWLHA
jgi:hypothetical protein